MAVAGTPAALAVLRDTVRLLDAGACGFIKKPLRFPGFCSEGIKE